MTPKKPRIDEIDILRGFAILLVFLYHSITVYPVNLHEIPWCAALHRFLWSIHMPLFFFVSGFCYPAGKLFTGKDSSTGKTFAKKLFTKESLNSYLKYLNSKTKRILVPHIFFGLIDIVPRLIPNPFVNETLSDPGEALSFFFIYGGSDWFLLTLFIICLIFPFAEYFISGENRKIKLTFLLIISLVVYIFHSKLTDILCLNLVAAFFILFLIGFLFREHIDKLQTSNQYNGTIAVLKLNGAVFLIAAAITYYVYLRTNLRLAELVFVLFAGYFCILISKKIKEVSGPKGIMSFFILCGTWSLQMYLLDPYALVFTRVLLAKLPFTIPPLLIILGNFIPDTFIALFITLFILNRFRILRFVSGIK